MLAGSFKLLKVAHETQDEEMQRKSSPIIMNKVFQEVSEKQPKKKKNQTNTNQKALKKPQTPNKKSPNPPTLEHTYFSVLWLEHHMRVPFAESFVFSL